MPRLVYLLGVGMLLGTGGFLLTDWLLTPPPGFSLANARRVREGMSRQQVEALLGALPPDRVRWWVMRNTSTGWRYHQVSLWEGPEAAINVWFEHERVVEVVFTRGGAGGAVPASTWLGK